MHDGENGDHRCCLHDPGESLQRYLALVKGGLNVASIIAAATGHDSLCLLAQALVAIGDAVSEVVR